MQNIILWALPLPLSFTPLLSLPLSLPCYLSLSLAISVIPACAKAWKIRVQCQLQANDSTESYVGATRRMINEKSRIHIHAHVHRVPRVHEADCEKTDKTCKANETKEGGGGREEEAPLYAESINNNVD